MRWNSHKPVLSVFPTPDTSTAEPHTIPWGENTETTTDSDETNAESEHDNNIQHDTQQIDDSEQFNESGDGDTLTSEDGDKQTTQHMQTTENENQERMPTSPLPTIEPLPYSSESDLTAVPMTASMTTPNEPQGSSSEEPSWGRTRQKSSKELADDWQTWETTNTRKTPEGDASGWEAWNTPKYRHDRCNMCHKPVTITWIENDTAFLCLECTPTVIEGDTVGESTNTKGDGRRERNDEEEWGRIPIPQSDDSYSTEGWLTDDSDQDE